MNGKYILGAYIYNIIMCDTERGIEELLFMCKVLFTIVMQINVTYAECWARGWRDQSGMDLRQISVVMT